MKKYIGVRKAAGMLHTSDVSLRKKIVDGTCEIPHLNLGYVNKNLIVKFKLEDVEKYLESKMVSPKESKVVDKI